MHNSLGLGIDEIAVDSGGLAMFLKFHAEI